MQTNWCWWHQISSLYDGFTFNISTESLPFCHMHLDDVEFSVAIYEFANAFPSLMVIDCLALNFKFKF